MKMQSLLLSAALVAGMMIAGSSAALAQGTQFFVVLNGGNEVSAAGQANAGDPRGFGSAAVMIRGTSTLCYALLVNAIRRPTAAHVHEALAGRNGPVVVPLEAPDRGNPGTSSGCVTGLDPALLRRIARNPSRFYINVHNNQFPGGAIRGQLF